MELLLDTQELLDLGRNMKNVKIVCREGRCWVTQEGDNRDHIMAAGESFISRNSGRLIVTATESCRLMLCETSPAKQRQATRTLIPWAKRSREVMNLLGCYEIRILPPRSIKSSPSTN